MLAEEGVVVVIVTVDTQAGEIVTGPEIVTRGWVYAPEAEDLIEDAKQVVRVSLEEAIKEGAPTWTRCGDRGARSESSSTARAAADRDPGRHGV